MALLEGQFQVRDLVMGPGTPYRMLTQTNPFTRQTRAEQSGKRAWNHGAWSGAEWSEEAVVPMRVLVDTDNTADWLSAHQALTKAFRPVGESVSDVEMRFALGGQEWLMFGRPRMVEPETQLIALGQSFSKCAFVALDPFIYAAQPTSVSTGLPQFTGGLSIPAGHPVLNTDSGFESGTGGYFDFNGTLAQSTAQVYVGSASALATPDGSGGTGVYGTSGTNNPTVVAGTSYRNHMWLYSPAGWGDFVPVIRWYDSTGAEIAQTEGASTAVPAGEWTHLELIDVAPSGAAEASARVWQSSSPTTSDEFHIDELRFQRHDGGLSVPLSITASLSQGFLDLTNNGTAPTPMVWHIDGPASEPRVVLQRADGTYAQLRMPFDVPAGHYLEVDTGNRTVLLDGVTNRRGFVIGEFPLLPPEGPHRIRWFANEYDPAAKFTVTYQERNW